MTTPDNSHLLGVDIGGTFTDFVLAQPDGKIQLHKRLTSGDDPARSFLQGIADLNLPAGADIIHGSTVATNALLERTGARTALIATRGFADVLEIGRQHRPDLYALVPVKPPPLVPRQWRFELTERVSADGEVIAAPADSDIADLIKRLHDEQIASVAICFLFSYLRPEHEQQVAAALTRAGFGHVTLSSALLPEYREYERTSTTVINAYVAPLVHRYLERLADGLGGRALRIMQSNGGTITAATAQTESARTALSGPAGGVVGAMAVAKASGHSRLITFDMGGTSTDVALCDDTLPLTAEGEIGGQPLRLPIIDIHTVGAGGGSLARVDEGAALVVGPQSAGANPGPACYGLGGTRPTVTDANLVLGRLQARHFLGGQMPLNETAARQSLAQLARAMQAASAEEAAWGVVRVANATMERAIRKISVERGYDPRDFALVAFGGAGPLHACELAGHLNIPLVIVPRAPGVLSALGMVLADRVKDYSQTVMRQANQLAPHALEALFAPLEARARADMQREQVVAFQLGRSLDMRYRGQSFEINVRADTGADWLAEFHRLHLARYGHSHPDESVEVVTVRLRAVGDTTKPQFEQVAVRAAGSPLRAMGGATVWFDSAGGGIAPVDTLIYGRDTLCAGDQLAGPAILAQLDATSAIPPGWVGTVDAVGNVLLRQAVA